jgi:hypothetical protein
MGKRFIISESEKNNIRKMYGILNEQSDVISQYVTDSRLQDILREIETTLGEKFTKEHFEKEIGLSGQIKDEAGGLLPEVEKAFEKMKKEAGCPKIAIRDDVSYRTYEFQKNQFLQYAKNTPKIDSAMVQASIPGFSAHHTGRAIDYYEDGASNYDCLIKKGWPNGDFNTPNKWGFTLPYMSGNIRKKEPWHLQYVGTTKKQDAQNKTDQKQTSSNSLIDIKSSTYDDFANQIREKTSEKLIDINSIDFDFPKKTLTINSGNEKIDKIVLIIGRKADGLTMQENLEKRYESAVKKNPNSTVESFGIPTTCNDCFNVPVKYQLLIVKPKNKNLESDSFIYE